MFQKKIELEVYRGISHLLVQKFHVIGTDRLLKYLNDIAFTLENLNNM